MTPQYVLSLGREAITLTLLVSAPMLIFGLVVGLLISILQAVTQIHEMTLTFIPKIVAVALALLLFLPWIINIMVDFTTRLFGTIPTLVG
ncbi:MAG: flagellar biosynthesis protein FliQ [candidate division Zixibacteria bacterium]|nr:flagellar biosynthesis protein FliQ [candidate division Zixibacteria bacterium]